MVRPEQILQWRTQLADQPASVARDLASALLVELERARLEAAEYYQRFSATQAGLIRAQLSAAPPDCGACGDRALRRVEERMRLSGAMMPEATPGIPLPQVSPPRRP